MLLVAIAFFIKTLTDTVEAFNDLMTIKRNKQILHIQGLWWIGFMFAIYIICYLIFLHRSYFRA